jgi:hypothetical protein
MLFFYLCEGGTRCTRGIRAQAKAAVGARVTYARKQGQAVGGAIGGYFAASYSSDLIDVVTNKIK